MKRENVSRRHSRPKNVRRTPQQRRLTMQRLDQRQLLAADLGLLDDGLQSGFFGNLQSTINQDVLATPAPFVGSALADSLTNESGQSNQFFASIESKLQQLDIASDATIAEATQQIATALEIDPSSIRVSGDDGDSLIRFNISFSESFVSPAGVDLELVGADPELEVLLGTENAVDLQVDLTYEIAFGVQENAEGISQFFFNTDILDEVTIDYAATLREDFDSGKGRVGVFIADFEHGGTDASQFNGQYKLNLEQSDDAILIGGSLTGEGAAVLDIDAAFFPNVDLGTDLINLGVTAEGSVTYDTKIDFENGGINADDNEIIVGIND
ncbi:MAG: hypothetical protein AAFP90_10220, partial [Planctomycetota bacterium]